MKYRFRSRLFSVLGTARVLVCVSVFVLGGMSLLFADDYVDDAYFWPSAHSKQLRVDATAFQEGVDAEYQISATEDNELPAQKADSVANVRFIQVSDTVVKAIIRR